MSIRTNFAEKQMTSTHSIEDEELTSDAKAKDMTSCPRGALRLKPWPQGLHQCHLVLHHAMFSCSQHWKQQNDGWPGVVNILIQKFSIHLKKPILMNEESVVMESPSLVLSVILVGKFSVLNQCQNNLLELSLCQLAALLEASQLSTVLKFRLWNASGTVSEQRYHRWRFSAVTALLEMTGCIYHHLL